MSHADTAAEIFPHVRIVIGFVLSLSIARLLTGTARFIQYPGREQVYWVHLGWVLTLLITIVHFWWWEFRLFAITTWTFELYFFLIVYAILLFLLCTLLFPDRMDEYDGYADYLMSRRRWFFGLLALTFVFDVADTLIKGPAHVEFVGTEYFVRIAVYVALCIVAMVTADRRFHAAFVSLSLIYQLSWIFRLYSTIG